MRIFDKNVKFCSFSAFEEKYVLESDSSQALFSVEVWKSIEEKIIYKHFNDPMLGLDLV